MQRTRPSQEFPPDPYAASMEANFLRIFAGSFPSVKYGSNTRDWCGSGRSGGGFDHLSSGSCSLKGTGSVAPVSRPTMNRKAWYTSPLLMATTRWAMPKNVYLMVWASCSSLGIMSSTTSGAKCLKSSRKPRHKPSPQVSHPPPSCVALTASAATQWFPVPPVRYVPM
jgi:hypothetical protein